MAVNIHITIIELNALHTKRQNLFQELDAVIHLLMEAKHWGLKKSKNATSLNSRFKSLDTLKFNFFFNDTATTEIYTLSLHDALPISPDSNSGLVPRLSGHPIIVRFRPRFQLAPVRLWDRSEEHTSELQSHSDLVCRLLLEKKNRYAQSQNNQYDIQKSNKDEP